LHSLSDGRIFERHGASGQERVVNQDQAAVAPGVDRVLPLNPTSLFEANGQDLFAAPILAELQGQAVRDTKPITEPVTTGVPTGSDKPVVPVSDC
jgi:hypothetical protein